MGKLNLNQRIAERYTADCIKKGENLTELQMDKVKYAMMVILNEVEKFLMLTVMFAILGEIKIYIISLAVVLSVRFTIGGYHRKTFWGCFFFSLCFLSVVIMMTKFISLPDIFPIMIFLLYCVFIALKAPILPEYRPEPDDKRKKKLKVYACIIMGVWLAFCEITTDGTIRGCIEWTLLLQLSEILVVEGGKKWAKEL